MVRILCRSVVVLDLLPLGPGLRLVTGFGVTRREEKLWGEQKTADRNCEFSDLSNWNVTSQYLLASFFRVSPWLVEWKQRRAIRF